MKSPQPNTPYRKVVAQLNDCEQRYQKLMRSVDETPNSPLAAALSDLRKEVRQRRSLEIALLEAVEQERLRIGQDLHDDLCQRLGAAALLAGSIAKEIRRHDQKLGEEAAQVPRHVNAAIASCRDIARGLNPLTLESRGLPAALEELGQNLPLNVRLIWPRTKRIQLEPSIALHLYRIAEEAVGNAVKHSGARTVKIELRNDLRKVVLEISDDGNGINTKIKTQGMGLRNMQYRANVIGADLSIRGEAGKGTWVGCILPYGKSQRGPRKSPVLPS